MSVRSISRWVLWAVVVGLALTAGVSPASASPEYIYWADETTGEIGRANVDGSNPDQSFITGAANSQGVAIDGDYIYWTDPTVGTVGRAKLDGSGVSQTFITGAANPRGVAVDGDYVYWTNDLDGLGAIGRANLDGSGVNHKFIFPVKDPQDVAVDGDYVYWTSPDLNAIARANIDGTNPETFIPGLDLPTGLAVDGTYIYWSNRGTGSIGRADLSNGQPDTSFIASANGTRGVAVDGAHIYWGTGPTINGPGTIGRANLDGSGADRNFMTADAPFGLAVTVPTEPVTAIDAGPGDTTDGVADFTFSADETSKFVCQLTGTGQTPGFTACGSPEKYTDLADGSYQFWVKATDLGGNTDATPASQAFTVDTTEPVTTIGTGPGSTSDGIADFTFSANESSTFKCKLDGPGVATGTFSSCNSPKQYAGLADGNYTFSVRATDNAGNTDFTPATEAFTVDNNTPPDTTVETGPGSTTDRIADFSFKASESSTFECELVGPGHPAGFTTCTSPQQYTGLADGNYTFSVKATDTAGNIDPTPDTEAFAVDGTAPFTTINAGPGTTTDGTADFTFSANESSTFECELVGPGHPAGFTTCNSPKQYTGLADGNYTFSVKATDTADISDETPATQTFTMTTPDAGSGPAPAATCGGLPATIVGTEGADNISGTPGNDVIASGDGHDIVRGSGGNDTICGGDDDDTLAGGAGKDVLYGQAGSDTLKGGRGTDRCIGGTGVDRAKKCETVGSL